LFSFITGNDEVVNNISRITEPMLSFVVALKTHVNWNGAWLSKVGIVFLVIATGKNYRLVTEVKRTVFYLTCNIIACRSWNFVRIRRINCNVMLNHLSCLTVTEDMNMNT
jgi:hypothetical protein